MVYVYIFMFSLTGYLGVNVVLNLVKMYGALIAVTGMLCFISILFRSTPKSRPNNLYMGLRMSVRPSVHKKFFRFR